MSNVKGYSNKQNLRSKYRGEVELVVKHYFNHENNIIDFCSKCIMEFESRGNIQRVREFQNIKDECIIGRNELVEDIIGMVGLD